MYTVHLPQEAMAELVEAWTSGLPQCCADIELGLVLLQSLLEEDPAGSGESRGGGERVVFAGGVAALYEVYPESRVVRVLRAWSFRRGR